MQETYLDRRDLLPDPLAQFALWYEEAQQSTVALPHAMVLATADAQGRPSARMVLLKECDQRGFVFYTNSNSHKGRDLSQNPRAALVFHWEPLRKQVRVEGDVERVFSVGNISGRVSSKSYLACATRASHSSDDWTREYITDEFTL